MIYSHSPEAGLSRAVATGYSNMGINFPLGCVCTWGISILKRDADGSKSADVADFGD